MIQKTGSLQNKIPPFPPATTPITSMQDLDQIFCRQESHSESTAKAYHIELYCIGPNTFIRRHEEQSYTHNLLPKGTEKPVVQGYELISKAFV